MSSSPSAVPMPPISELLGGMLVMTCGAFVLYGVTSAQSYIYSLNCKDDPAWMKWLVGVIWTLETVHSGFLLRQLYYMVIISFGDADAIGRIDWSIAAVAFLEILITGLVEGYYIWRIWILSNRSLIYVLFLIVLLVTRLGFNFSLGVFTLLTDTWIHFQEAFGPDLSVLMTNILSAVVDGVIAISMLILLRRSRAGFNYGMDNVLRWLIAYSVNTGAISMVVSIVIAITYSTLKGNLTFLGLVALTGKLYANALLGMLNARKLMRQKAQPSANIALSRFSGSRSDDRASPSGSLQLKSQQDGPDVFILNDQVEGQRTSLSKDHESVNDVRPSTMGRSKSPSIRIQIRRSVDIMKG